MNSHVSVPGQTGAIMADTPLADAVVRLENVKRHFGETPALDGVSLTVRKGEILGIIGRSGAGKSTLIRCLNGLERPESGAIFVEGRQITGLSERELQPFRRRIGMIFQHFNLLSAKTVEENVALPLKIEGRPRAERLNRARELLDLVGLSDKARAYPSSLSGGQKQRVGIARALAMEPKVLLLDEPFGALDALTRAHLQDSVMALHQKLGNTILMITHDVDEAVLLSDRIVMMTNGPAARIGEVLEVPLARPRKRLELATNAGYLKCRQRVLEFLYERHSFVEAA